jgi:molybdenum cofactor cytidylyltransferase
LLTSKNKSVAGIILAAGSSSRFGKPKQLLDWFGRSFINQIISVVFESQLSPIILVLGANFSDIYSNIELQYLSRLKIVRNDDWEAGQSTSLIKGINALGKDPTSFMFLLSDQPQVTAQLVNKLINSYRSSNADIVVTRANGQRTPPILFSRKCINELKKMRGYVGGRAVINKFNAIDLEWNDKKIAFDIDSREDYKQLVEYYENIK